jgi:hypothetical protein
MLAWDRGVIAFAREIQRLNDMATPDSKSQLRSVKQIEKIMNVAEEHSRRVAEQSIGATAPKP